jgi:hypothetical protein
MKAADGSVMYVTFDCTHDDAPEKETNVVMSCDWVYVISPRGKRGGQKRTVVELYTQLDFKVDDTRLSYEKLRKPLTCRAIGQIQVS